MNLGLVAVIDVLLVVAAAAATYFPAKAEGELKGYHLGYRDGRFDERNGVKNPYEDV